MKEIYYSLIHIIDYVAEAKEFVKVQIQMAVTEEKISDLNYALKKRCEMFSVSLSMIQFGETIEIYFYPPGK